MNYNRRRREIERQGVGILYFDENCIIANKPRGIVTSLDGRWDTTLQGIIRESFPDYAPAHRLDRWTSGIVAGGTNDHSRAILGRQFQDRTVEKVYVAAVYGRMLEGERGKIDAPIAHDNRSATSCIGENGKYARTDYLGIGNRIIIGGSKVSIVALRPHTGRTHQIRVHLKHIGYPVFNDPVYFNGRRGTGQFLHAAFLMIDVPTNGDRVEFFTMPDWITGNLESAVKGAVEELRR